MSGDALTNLIDVLESLKRLRREKAALFFEPYPPQQEFFDLGTSKRERCLMAGNQNGKTFAGAFEMMCHLTGDYPDWWLGRRFPHAVKAWACGESGTVVRDVLQKLLVGPPEIEGEWGTGMIPREALLETTRARGVPNLLDNIVVRHKTGGFSILHFKSYEQGRTKFQGDSIHVGWCDEEPDVEIYTEILTRTNATGGLIYMTFTPLKGASKTVLRFTDEPDMKDRGLVVMTLYDAKHISEEQRLKIIASYQAHERDARVYGTPMHGDGLIFPWSQDAIQEPRIDDLPDAWTKLWGVDFGIDHPFAAVLTAWDRDADIIHVIHTIRMKDTYPLQHAVPMKKIAANVRVAWPRDGHNRHDDGEEFHLHYKRQGLLMMPYHAQWEDGGVSTEAGVLEMNERFQTGRLRVASHLNEYFDEHRSYHRKKGLIVKERDDIMSATRIAIMQKRSGWPGAIGSFVPKRKQVVARDVDFDLFHPNG